MNIQIPEEALNIVIAWLRALSHASDGFSTLLTDEVERQKGVEDEEMG